MWENPHEKDQIEFEADLIASSNDILYSNKQIMKYESEYYRPHEEQFEARELPDHVVEKVRKLYQQFAVR